MHVCFVVDYCYLSLGTNRCGLVLGPTLGQGNVDSARQNLASSFVNGFVNAAFGKDKLLVEDGTAWLYKNKEHGESTLAITLVVLNP